MKVLNKYFGSEWSVSKIKIPERLKTVAFDSKNHKLTIITYDRVIYNVPIPDAPSRYLEGAEIRLVNSCYT